jgi:prevent-host-death family protein
VVGKIKDMQAIPIRELKAHFSSILQRVKSGETIVISYGKKKEKIAVLVPYQSHKPKKPRKLGILKGKAKCIITSGFSLTDEKLLSL